MTDDLDLKEFITKIIIWVVVVAIFGSLMTIILINKFGSKDIRINKKIDSKKELVVLIVKSNGKNTKQIQNKLKENGISYETVYSDRERYFDDFLKKLSLTEEDIIEPTILYIEDKEAKSSLVDIKNVETMDEYLESLKK